MPIEYFKNSRRTHNQYILIRSFEQRLKLLTLLQEKLLNWGSTWPLLSIEWEEYFWRTHCRCNIGAHSFICYHLIEKEKWSNAFLLVFKSTIYYKFNRSKEFLWNKLNNWKTNWLSPQPIRIEISNNFFRLASVEVIAPCPLFNIADSENTSCNLCGWQI